MAKVSPLTLIVLVFLSTTLSEENGGSDCSFQSIFERISTCITFQPSEISLAKKILGELCRSVECTIACFENAVGGCSLEGIFGLWDIMKNRVETRYICEDVDASSDAFKNCESLLNKQKCFVNLGKDAAAASYVTSSKSDHDYDAYFTTACRMATNFKSCSKSHPLEPSGTCTRANTDLLNQLFDISFSLSACNIPQDNDLFRIYGGTPVCNVGNRLMYNTPLYLCIIVFTSTYIFLIQ